MRRADVCYLIRESPGTHGLFDAAERTERMVYCTICSVVSVEFWRGYTAGASPSIVFELADPAEYHGERLVRHEKGGVSGYYRVIREFDNGKTVELTCEEAKAYDGQPDSGS